MRSHRPVGFVLNGAVSSIEYLYSPICGGLISRSGLYAAYFTSRSVGELR